MVPINPHCGHSWWHLSFSLWEYKILKDNSTAQFTPHTTNIWSDLEGSRHIFRVCWHLFRMSPMSLFSAEPLGLPEVATRIQTTALTLGPCAHKPTMSQLGGCFSCPLWHCKVSTVLGRQTSSLLYTVLPNQGHLIRVSTPLLTSKLTLFSFSFSVPREVYTLLFHLTSPRLQGAHISKRLYVEACKRGNWGSVRVSACLRSHSGVSKRQAFKCSSVRL